MRALISSPPSEPCLDESEVMALLSGAGDASSQRAHRAHLEACTDCQELVALLASRDDASLGRIGRYAVRRELGRGATGTVFLAHDPELDRPVALKVLRACGPNVERRMRSEARALARLAHPNVVTVFEIGVFDDQVFMAMEYLEGSTLRSWLRDQPRDRDAVLAIFLLAGEGLLAAHDAEIIHRDFKPDNVLVGHGGRVCVVDFGLAHVDTVEQTGSTSLSLTATTHTRGIVGTPAYMAPEQHLGQEVDARSDQFAFAVSLAEALTGARPVEGSTIDELRERAMRGAVALRGLANDPIARVLRRGLMPRAEQRYPSMRELLIDLRRHHARPKRALRAALVGIGVTVLVGASASAYMTTRAPGAPAPPAPVAAAAPRPPSTREPLGDASPAIGARPSASALTTPLATARRPSAAQKPIREGGRANAGAATTGAAVPTRSFTLGVNDTPILE